MNPGLDERYMVDLEAGTVTFESGYVATITAITDEHGFDPETVADIVLVHFALPRHGHCTIDLRDTEVEYETLH